MIVARNQCRLCESGNIEEVVDLGHSPLANAYLSPAQLADVQSGRTEEIFTPLRCFLCLECGSVQLAHSVPGDVLFSDYIYASSTSPVFVLHFEKLAAQTEAMGLVSENDLVVDIGSNDGVGMLAFKQRGCRVAGVEPSAKLAGMAAVRNLPTICEFLSMEVAQKIRSNLGPARVVTATNVFAHLSDLRGFVDAVKEMLDTDGVFIFENSYLGDVVNDLLFDTIYMEHQFYHSVTPLVRFFDSIGFPIYRVERIVTHGGSIRVFAGNRAPEPSVAEMMDEEIALLSPATYRKFSDRIQIYKHRLHSVLRQFKEVVAYGCPAKFTTFSYALELNERFKHVVDDSPLKCGLFTPGIHLPILPSSNLMSGDAVFVSAWNFFESIYDSNNAAAKHWIRPLPKLEVFP